jgi:O-antigen/teichoic acid export membrane protein
MSKLRSDNAAEDSSSILSRTAKGAGWTIGWRFATRAIGFCSTLILVRLLSPEDFGLVALATGVFQTLDVLVGFGVEGAIIRSDDADRALYDAGFTIKVARGILTSVVLVVAVHPIAAFFGGPSLVPVIYALAVGWTVAAFQNIGIVEFRRTLEFDQEFKLQLLPRLLSAFVTIATAFAWRSYWALVAGILMGRVLSVAMSYRMHPYRPRFGIARIRSIFAYSFWEWIIGLLNIVGGRADTLLLGHFLGTGAVGVYGVGGEIASLPSTEVVAPLARALFSGFALERRAGQHGGATLVRAFSALALFTFPMSAGLSLVAEPLVRLAFGVEWLGAVPIIQVLGIASIIGLFGSVAESLFSAHAWLRTILWMSAVVSVFRVLMLLILIPQCGLLGAALAAAVAGLVQEVLFVGVAVARLRIRVRDLLMAVARPLAAISIMALMLVTSGLIGAGAPSTNGLVFQLAAGIALGAVTYVGSLLALWMLAGSPEGPEAEALRLMRRLVLRATV